MAENPLPVVLVDSIACHSPSEISDYLFTLQHKAFPDLSAIEIEDQRIPGTFIMPQSSVHSSIPTQLRLSWIQQHGRDLVLLTSLWISS